MIWKVRLLLLWIAFIPLGLTAQGIVDVIAGLGRLDGLVSTGKVEVTPMGSDEAVTYDVVLRSSPNRGSRKRPVNYVVDYKLTRGDTTWCFASFDGKRYYRFDGREFVELPDGNDDVPAETVRHSRFAELLPQYIAEELQSAAQDDLSAIKVEEDGPDRVLVEVSRNADGTEFSRGRYVFDKATYAPLSVSRVSNPGTENELAIVATLMPKRAPQVTAASVDSLHGDVIGLFSRANLRPENFAGYRMPIFSLPALRGGRFTFTPQAETLIVMIDDSVSDALEDTRLAVRDGLARHPRGAEVDILYVLLSRFADAVPASDSSTRHEKILLDGNHLAERMGADKFPLLILVDDDGVVDAVGSCRNNELPDFVIDVMGR